MFSASNGEYDCVNSFLLVVKAADDVDKINYLPELKLNLLLSLIQIQNQALQACTVASILYLLHLTDNEHTYREVIPPGTKSA